MILDYWGTAAFTFSHKCAVDALRMWSAQLKSFGGTVSIEDIKLQQLPFLTHMHASAHTNSELV